MSRAPVSVDHATALIVGVGGIGAPAAWALARAGISRLILVDPDVVEASNLPRQILYSLDDVGRPKAEAAAERLRGSGVETEALVAAVDAENGPTLFARCDVVIDGTDGATAKDLVNALAVTAGVPLIHAAAIGSEGRVLDVPAGGRPCLACLFGTTAAGGGGGDTCARVGVWNGVTGVVGFLAAQAAIDRLADPTGASKGLRVIDLAEGRGVTLRANADPRCLVCGEGRAALPSYAGGGRAKGGAGGPVPAGALDLTNEFCPMNLLLARRAVDRLAVGSDLEILLGSEGAETVPEGLAALGHQVLVREARGAGARVVVRARRKEESLTLPNAHESWLRRYARQIVLPEIGEEGQRRLGEARVLVVGGGDAMLAASVYLAAAGVGTIRLFDDATVEGAHADRWPFTFRDAGKRRDDALGHALRHLTGADVHPIRKTHVDATAFSTSLLVAGAEGDTTERLVAEANAAGKPWVALELDDSGGCFVRTAVPGAGTTSFTAPILGAVKLAGGALAADVLSRQLLGLPPPGGGTAIAADGSVYLLKRLTKSK